MYTFTKYLSDLAPQYVFVRIQVPTGTGTQSLYEMIPVFVYEWVTCV